MDNIQLFPPAFQSKNRIKALSRIMDSRFKKLKQEIFDNLFIFVLSSQSDTVLDHLALQFRADGYEFASTKIQKIDLIQSALSSRLHRGTRSALKQLFTALGVDILLQEWTEYGGTPYTYRIELQGRSLQISPELQRKLINLIQSYANVRSHPDDVKLAYRVSSGLFLLRAIHCDLEIQTKIPLVIMQTKALPVNFGIGITPCLTATAKTKEET